MNRLSITVVVVVFVFASHQACPAQTNVISVCLRGWNAASSTNAHPVRLYWTHGAANTVGIGIERSASPTGPWSLIGIAEPTVTNFTDRTVLCALSYWYRVYAFNSAGESGYSNTAGPTTEGPCP